MFLNRLGHIYSFLLKQDEQAIDYYQQALMISGEMNDRGKECHALGYLGGACYRLGQVNQAIDYYKQALAIAQEIGNRGCVQIWGRNWWMA